jgi:hypothetical protein
LALQAISLLTRRRLVDDIERHPTDVDLVVVPRPCPLNVQPIDLRPYRRVHRQRAEAGQLDAMSRPTHTPG